MNDPERANSSRSHEHETEAVRDYDFEQDAVATPPDVTVTGKEYSKCDLYRRL
jgi:hypothetical protein